MEVAYDVAVIGGGPAGCAAAITAARLGYKTVLFERGRYPRHKVCGEFVSPESHDVLLSLLGSSHELLLAPATIVQARMFSDRQQIHFDLPHPAWSISRYDLDHALWKAAYSSGVDCREATPVEGLEHESVIAGENTIRAKRVINASGRWSNLRRTHIMPGQHWLGIKAHFSGEHAPPSTDIYFFRGGYCGIQPVGSGIVNASAMVRSDVARSLEEVFAASPELWFRSRGWEQLTETVSTFPLIHATPVPLNDRVMNVGDAAGFVDPFIGDGISIALRSGSLAAQCIGDIQHYAREYTRRFGNIFQTAAFARGLAHAPQFVRRIAIFGFQSRRIREFALSRTRAS